MSERIVVHLVWAATVMTVSSMALVVSLAWSRCDDVAPLAIGGVLSLAGPATAFMALLLRRVIPRGEDDVRPST